MIRNILSPFKCRITHRSNGVALHSQRIRYNFSSAVNMKDLSGVISIADVHNYQKETTQLQNLHSFCYNYINESTDGKLLVKSIQKPKFYDFSCTKEFSQEATLSQVCQNDFFVHSQEDNVLIAVLRNIPFEQGLIKSSDQHIFSEICEGLNLSRQESLILSQYVTKFSLEMANTPSTQLDLKYIHIISNKILTELSLNSKKKIAVYDALLSVLRNNLSKQIIKQKALYDELDLKSNKYLKYIFSAALIKIFALQYCTYVLLSWDIMEPITCLLGVVDIGFAYFFWLLTHSEFDFLNLKQGYFKKKKLNPKNFTLLASIDHTQSIIDYLQEQKDIQSPSFQTILKLL